VATFKMTDERLDALWMAVAVAYSVVHDVRALETHEAGTQCSHAAHGVRCTAPATHARGTKVYCDTHAAKIRAQRAPVYARAVTAYRALVARGITTQAQYDAAIRDAATKPSAGTVTRTARPD
jgi:hypothetical protein